MTTERDQSLQLDAAHREATDDVNRWRGYCTEKFARIDDAVKDTLEAMAAADEKAKIRAPHLFGQRMAAVRDALQPGQPLAAKACTALKVLDKLRPHLERRNILIHATGSVWINASGAWRWQLHAIGPEPDSG